MALLVALMTCHNRRETTATSVGCYFACEVPEGISRELVLVDDGSTDGTAEAIERNFPQALIERGDGSLFWTRGMRRAWERALRLAPDFVLWLNDDTMLYADALRRLLETEHQMRAQCGQAGIAVGSTQGAGGELTYGGMVSVSRLNRLKMRKVVPGKAPLPVQTMNGNCVLVPREVFERIGLLDGVFVHAMGDNDYGFRAHRAGIPIWVAPGYCGRCDMGERTVGTYRDDGLPFRSRWRHVLSPKGLPPRSWFAITRRHAGPLWLGVWALPYAKIIGSSFRRHVGRGGC